jgi:large subunit ribosomal protein L33
MASKSREIVKLKSTEKDSKAVYWTTKNKKTTTQRLELKKYDPTLRKHVIFKEAK